MSAWSEIEHLISYVVMLLVVGWVMAWLSGFPIVD